MFCDVHNQTRETGYLKQIKESDTRRKHQDYPSLSLVQGGFVAQYRLLFRGRWREKYRGTANTPLARKSAHRHDQTQRAEIGGRMTVVIAEEGG
jgi:hypothetical protein